MAAAPDLLYVYKRICSRIEDGNSQFDKLTKIFHKQADVYEKTAKNLQEILNLEFDETDMLEKYIMDSIKNEISMYNVMTEKFRSDVLNPAVSRAESNVTDAKKLNKALSKECSKLEKALKQLKDSKNYLNDTKKKITETKDPKKVEKLKIKIAKAEEDYNSKFRNADEISVFSQSTEMPKIHKSFIDYDRSRMVTMQTCSVKYVDLRMKMNSALGEKLTKMYNQFVSYDAKDRSSRYVSRCFDPNIKASIEDEEMYVIAINDYRSEQPGDLEFRRGDKIKVLLQHSSGWWDGELNGKKGTFPKTYVHVLKESKSSYIQIGTNFVIDKNYQAAGKAEIDIDEGDVVYVDYIKNGKANGVNLRTKKFGNIPIELLEM